jgi:hypothetical protein
MFIFDAGTMKKDVKGMRIFRCSNCNENTPHDITEIGFYITALELPIAPYKKKYVLMCRKCGLGEEVKKEEFKHLLLHNEGEMQNSSSDRILQKRLKNKFCRFCGAKMRRGAKFCNECGKPIL